MFLAVFKYEYIMKLRIFYGNIYLRGFYKLKRVIALMSKAIIITIINIAFTFVKNLI